MSGYYDFRDWEGNKLIRVYDMNIDLLNDVKTILFRHGHEDLMCGTKKDWKEHNSVNGVKK